jgi:hypothetical protein
MTSRVIGSSMPSVGEVAPARDAISTARPVTPHRSFPEHQTSSGALVLHVCAPDEPSAMEHGQEQAYGGGELTRSGRTAPVLGHPVSRSRTHQGPKATGALQQGGKWLLICLIMRIFCHTHCFQVCCNAYPIPSSLQKLEMCQSRQVATHIYLNFWSIQI